MKDRRNIERLLLDIKNSTKRAYAKRPGDQYVLLRRRYFIHTIRTLIYIVDSRGKFSHKHSKNVAKHCIRIAKTLRFKKYDILRIKIAAFFHDLGKYEIDKAILNKPGKLTEEEWQEIRKHPVISAKIVKETGILSEIIEAVRHHHERFDGGGYPDPDKKGSNIPLDSRIIAVADAYDAMVSKRPYRKRALTRREAIMELKRCTGTQFDPQIVDAFI